MRVKASLENVPYRGIMLRFDQIVPAKLSAQFFQGTRGGSEDRRSSRQPLAKMISEAFRSEVQLTLCRCAENQLDQAAEGRIAESPPLFQLPGEKGIKVMGESALEGIMIRLKALYDNAAGPIAATRAAGHLGDQLEGPFGRTEVGKVQGGLGEEDTDQGHLVVVVSLGEDLCSDQNVDLTSFHFQ